MAGRLTASTRSDRTVRRSSSRYRAAGSADANSSTPVAVPKHRLYRHTDRTTLRIANRRDARSAPASSSAAHRSDVSRTAARFTHDSATVTANPYILITSVNSPIASAPVFRLIYALKLTAIPRITILTTDKSSAFPRNKFRFFMFGSFGGCECGFYVKGERSLFEKSSAKTFNLCSRFLQLT